MVGRVLDPTEHWRFRGVAGIEVEEVIAPCHLPRALDELVRDTPERRDALAVDQPHHGEVAVAPVARDLLVGQVPPGAWLRCCRAHGPPPSSCDALSCYQMRAAASSGPSVQERGRTRRRSFDERPGSGDGNAATCPVLQPRQDGTPGSTWQPPSVAR